MTLLPTLAHRFGAMQTCIPPLLAIALSGRVRAEFDHLVDVRPAIEATLQVR
jgi:hypothetical protein